MSLKKAEQYREYKKNRKKILAKEKRRKKMMNALSVTVLSLFAICIIVVFGSVVMDTVKKYQASIPKYDYVAEDRVIGDMVGVLEEETEETTNDEADGEKAEDNSEKKE